MKKLVSVLTLSLTLIMISCSKYDDTSLRERVNALEAWQQTTNEQISLLQKLIHALEITITLHR